MPYGQRSFSSNVSVCACVCVCAHEPEVNKLLMFSFDFPHLQRKSGYIAGITFSMKMPASRATPETTTPTVAQHATENCTAHTIFHGTLQKSHIRLLSLCFSSVQFTFCSQAERILDYVWCRLLLIANLCNSKCTKQIHNTLFAMLYTISLDLISLQHCFLREIPCTFARGREREKHFSQCQFSIRCRCDEVLSRVMTMSQLSSTKEKPGNFGFLSLE